MKNNTVARMKKLYDLMLEQNLSEMEYKEDDFYIFLKRKTTQSAPSQSEVVQEVRKIEREIINTGESIKSPINGVIYHASTPKSPPFVNVGDMVDVGKTICIIEAMKVMNEIKADRKMKILKILVENGKSVTQGQGIFLYEPAL